MKVRNKIADVPDELCRECPLYWEGECRAFEIPQSDEERARRATGMPKCYLKDYGSVIDAAI